MKRIFSLICLFSLFLSAGAQNAAREVTISNSADKQSILYGFLPQHATGRAVICCPGGGYEWLAMDHEGLQWKDYFNNQGIAFFVLKYRLPKGDRTLPLSDAYNAIQTVRDSAAAWHINPNDVGIMGFSAGGHLASAVSTHANAQHRPNFSLLFYPVISMDEKISHQGSVVNFLGEGRKDAKLVNEWSSDKAVVRHLTPPTLIILANDDDVVPPVTNGIAYYSAMRNMGSDASLIVYPTGGHGFGFNPDYKYHQQMLDEITSWLNHLQAPKPDAKRVACIGNSITEGFGIDMCSANSYPTQLQQLLGPGYCVRNYGVSGFCMLAHSDCPYVRLPQWHDVLNFNPEIIVLKMGTNDTKPWNWQHADEFEQDYQHFIDTLKALPSKPEIILAYPIRAFDNPFSIRDSVLTASIIPTIKKLARRNHLQLLDLHSLFTPQLLSQSKERLIQQDGVHPTKAGAAMIAREVAKAIEKKE